MRIWELHSSFACFKSNIGCRGRRMGLRSVLSDAAAWTFLQWTVQLCIMEEHPKNHFILSQSLTAVQDSFLQESIMWPCSGAMESYLWSRGDSLCKQSKMNISYCQETIKFWGNGITDMEWFARFVWHWLYKQKLYNLFWTFRHPS